MSSISAAKQQSSSSSAAAAAAATAAPSKAATSLSAEELGRKLINDGLTAELRGDSATAKREYTEGLSILFRCLKAEANAKHKDELRKFIETYTVRAEKLKAAAD